MTHDPEFDFLGDRKIAELEKKKAELLKEPASLYRDFELKLVEKDLERWRANN